MYKSKTVKKEDVLRELNRLRKCGSLSSMQIVISRIEENLKLE